MDRDTITKDDLHLGTNDEVIEFSTEMITELNYHRDEKSSLRHWSFENVMLNNCPELVKRVNMIIQANVDIKNDLFKEKIRENLELIVKQSVHIANYSMFDYLIAKRELQKQLRVMHMSNWKIQRTEWFGIKNECCTNENIKESNDNVIDGKCCICKRCFTR